MATNNCEEPTCDIPDETDPGDAHVPGLSRLNKKPSSESLASQESVWPSDDYEVIRCFPLNTDGTTPEEALYISSSLGKRRADAQDEDDYDIRRIKKLRAESSEGSASTLTFSQSSSSTRSASIVVEIEKEDPYIISPSHRLQKLLNSNNVPYGVQFELARLTTTGELRYDDLDVSKPMKLANKSNAEAVPELPKVLQRESRQRDGKMFAKEEAAKSPWIELDHEEKNLKNWPADGCLGFREPGWHGGKVHFRGTLKQGKANPGRSTRKCIQYIIQLERAELGPSTRFARRFGSRSFFRIKVPKDILRDVDFETTGFSFFQRPLIICGDVFRAFYAKDANVFYFRTNEVYNEKGISPGSTGPGRLSIEGFLEWHNPIEINQKQTLAKYASRFNLGLSNSAPGLSLDPSQVDDIEDIISPASGSDMTDGAGFINEAALILLRDLFKWQGFPTAVQIRFAGAKGMVSRHHTDGDDKPRIYLRNSQKKIQYAASTEFDPAKFSIDVLRASTTHPTCRLSMETIINLAENGVPSKAFVDLLRLNGEALVKSFTNWEIPKAMEKLHAVVGREGRVMAARRAREDMVNARVLGYSNKSMRSQTMKMTCLRSQETFSTAWWADEISGSPSTLEETVLNLLVSGFTPSTCPILAAKLHEVIKSHLSSQILHLHIEVEMAATAFLIPDPLSILEPGEIFYKSRSDNLMMPSGIKSNIVLGDVLLGRNPTKLPGDIQKWKAVFRRELSHLSDVIVLSVKGDRRAADFLAGGDYDGDKGYLIWHPSLVSPFTNPSTELSQPPADMDKYFATGTEKVSDFLMATREHTEVEKYRRLQKYLLGALRDTTLVGMYSNYHDCAMYKLGYKHPETLRLAHMFCLVLDASKSGLTVLPDVLAKDSSKYNGSLYWKNKLKKKKKKDDKVDNDANTVVYPRGSGLAPFVMDVLCAAAEEEWNKLCAEENQIVDEDLRNPWLEQLRLCEVPEPDPRRKSDLNKIENHVKQVRQEWEAARTTARGPNHQRFTDLSIELRQDVLREISRKFHSYPKPEDVRLSQVDIEFTRASYAYIHDQEEKSGHWSRFPWDVAFRHLSELKARSTKRYTAMTDPFYSHAYFKV
ncbi:hypothetical protein BDN72DRAFT_831274 [Pluteus cervinus]|uniref:Uncharacterized protein n=1 Tax=Pluteus cervinus TaxID=181527 RepID=A0ACD3BCR3_9AGAR|nr:hypothetical protein BDN72DRAFT_831274 [Pluteus cervinus]